MIHFKKSNPNSFVVRAHMDSNYFKAAVDHNPPHQKGIVLQIIYLEKGEFLMELVPREQYQPGLKVPLYTDETVVKILEGIGYKVAYDLPTVPN